MVPGRVCGSCSLCCKLLRIEELDKPAGRWCSHCTAGRDGCNIYDTRPGSCRSFHCNWLINPELGADWRPTTAKMVLYYEPPARRLAVHVDPEFPSAWRGEPYYRQLKAWTCAAIDSARAPSPDAWLMAPILVYVNDRAIVMLPNRDIEVGTFTPGSHLVVTEKATASGPDFDACIMPSRDVPPASTEGAIPSSASSDLKMARTAGAIAPISEEGSKP